MVNLNKKYKINENANNETRRRHIVTMVNKYETIQDLRNSAITYNLEWPLLQTFLNPISRKIYKELTILYVDII